MDKYQDCQSCAFRNEELAICDICVDADQWEPAYEDEDLLNSNERPIVFKKREKLKEAA